MSKLRAKGKELKGTFLCALSDQFFYSDEFDQNRAGLHVHTGQNVSWTVEATFMGKC